MKLLALCDSPTLTSGFARVAQNLFKCWSKRGVTIDCWGICFSGSGYKNVPYVNNIYPGGDGGQWSTPDFLQRFLKLLANGKYTHVWIMQDTFLLSGNGFPLGLRQVCTDRKIKSMLYFPVDAPLDPIWTEIIGAVDVPVAYTQYGAQEAVIRARQRKNLTPPPSEYFYMDFQCAFEPHGIDTTVYRPFPNRKQFRHWLYQAQPWLTDDDFLIVNVNANQCRKDTPRTLEIFQGLRGRGVPAKLVMHMPPVGSPDQQINLDSCAFQLGLEPGSYGHHGILFNGSMGAMPESTEMKEPGKPCLASVYAMADLYLTTTLGEGWGLGITESLACGTPVAMPNHTSCREIGEMLRATGAEDMRVMLPLEAGTIVHRMDNSRMRHRVDMAKAIDVIEEYYRSGKWRNRVSIGEVPSLREWLSWDRIAARMLALYQQAVVKTPAQEVLAKAGELADSASYVKFGELEVAS